MLNRFLVGLIGLAELMTMRLIELGVTLVTSVMLLLNTSAVCGLLPDLYSLGKRCLVSCAIRLLTLYRIMSLILWRPSILCSAL